MTFLQFHRAMQEFSAAHPELNFNFLCQENINALEAHAYLYENITDYLPPDQVTILRDAFNISVRSTPCNADESATLSKALQILNARKLKKTKLGLDLLFKPEQAIDQIHSYIRMVYAEFLNNQREELESKEYIESIREKKEFLKKIVAEAEKFLNEEKKKLTEAMFERILHPNEPDGIPGSEVERKPTEDEVKAFINLVDKAENAVSGVQDFTVILSPSQEKKARDYADVFFPNDVPAYDYFIAEIERLVKDYRDRPSNSSSSYNLDGICGQAYLHTAHRIISLDFGDAEFRKPVAKQLAIKTWSEPGCFEDQVMKLACESRDAFLKMINAEKDIGLRTCLVSIVFRLAAEWKWDTDFQTEVLENAKQHLQRIIDEAKDLYQNSNAHQSTFPLLYRNFIDLTAQALDNYGRTIDRAIATAKLETMINIHVNSFAQLYPVSLDWEIKQRDIVLDHLRSETRSMIQAQPNWATQSERWIDQIQNAQLTITKQFRDTLSLFRLKYKLSDLLGHERMRIQSRIGLSFFMSARKTYAKVQALDSARRDILGLNNLSELEQITDDLLRNQNIIGARIIVGKLPFFAGRSRAKMNLLAFQQENFQRNKR